MSYIYGVIWTNNLFRMHIFLCKQLNFFGQAFDCLS